MVKVGRGYEGRATKLHALLVVEMRRKCERCKKTPPPEPACGHLVKRDNCEVCLSRRKKNTFQCAHIISRSYSSTRTKLDNAFCFCGACHLYTTRWPVEFARFIYRAIGKRKYLLLKTMATMPTKGRRINWKDEFYRLDEIAQAAGIEHECGPPPPKKKVKKKTKKTKVKKKGKL